MVFLRLLFTVDFVVCFVFPVCPGGPELSVVRHQTSLDTLCFFDNKADSWFGLLPDL